MQEIFRHSSFLLSFRRVLREHGLFLLLALAGCAKSPRPGDGVRLVSAAPGLTECVFAIGAGDCLAGRTEVCNYPPEALRIPVTGKFAQPFLEATLSVAPTHIIESAWVDADMRRRFEQSGIPVVHIPCSRVADIPCALRRLGALTGHGARAEEEAVRLERGLSVARRQAAETSHLPRVLILVDPDSLITAGANTFLSEMVSLAGGTNIAARTTADYYHLSLEWVLSRDPDLLLCLFPGRDPRPVAQTARFASRPGWRKLRAVREGMVFTVPDLDSVCRPGPRLLNGLKQLKAVFAGVTKNDPAFFPAKGR